MRSPTRVQLLGVPRHRCPMDRDALAAMPEAGPVAGAGAASVAALVTIGVAVGVVQIADSPARQAVTSRLVPPDDLASAVSLNGVVVNGARVVGPALGGVPRGGEDGGGGNWPPLVDPASKSRPTLMRGLATRRR